MRTMYIFLVITINILFCGANDTLAQPATAGTKDNPADYWYPIISKGKLGYMDNKGTLRINAELARVESYKLTNVKTDFIKADINDKVALFNRKAKMILEPRYSDITVDTSNKLIRVSQADEEEFSFMNDMVGFVDYEGKTVIPIQYHTQLFVSGYSFQEGLWCYTQDELQGYMDVKGKVVIAPQFYAAYDFKSGMAAVQHVKNGEWGYIDKTGKYKIAASFAAAGPFDESGYALVQKKSDDPTMSIINNKGKFMAKNIPYKATGGFMTMASFHNGLFVVYDSVQKKYGYMDHNGKLAIPIRYDYAQDFDKDGRALVNMGSTTDNTGLMASHTGGKWGFIDVRGNLTTPYFAAEDVSYLSEGLCCAKINGLWGFVDEKGQVAIKPQWKERPSSFEGGLARVYEKSKLPADGYKTYVAIGYINKQGEYVRRIQE